MPSGGYLRTEASAHPTAATLETIEGNLEGFVAIRVTDTGTGIAPEHLSKVCDPFFSTKGLNGTGLGLSMVRGLAHQSGGMLRINSELGKGTCVELCYQPHHLHRSPQPEVMPHGPATRCWHRGGGPMGLSQSVIHVIDWYALRSSRSMNLAVIDPQSNCARFCRDPHIAAPRPPPGASRARRNLLCYRSAQPAKKFSSFA
jgi:hypothetical protein